MPMFSRLRLAKRGLCLRLSLLTRATREVIISYYVTKSNSKKSPCGDFLLNMRFDVLFDDVCEDVATVFFKQLAVRTVSAVHKLERRKIGVSEMIKS